MAVDDRSTGGGGGSDLCLNLPGLNDGDDFLLENALNTMNEDDLDFDNISSFISEDAAEDGNFESLLNNMDPDDKKSCTCNECGKVFNSVWYLKQHAVKHSAERPFKCKNCYKTYRFRSNLYQHKCPFRGGDPSSMINGGLSCEFAMTRPYRINHKNGRLPKTSLAVVGNLPKRRSLPLKYAQNLNTGFLSGGAQSGFKQQRQNSQQRRRHNSQQRQNSLPHETNIFDSFAAAATKIGGQFWNNFQTTKNSIGQKSRDYKKCSNSPSTSGIGQTMTSSSPPVRLLTADEIRRFLDKHKASLYKCGACKIYFPAQPYLTRHMAWHAVEDHVTKCTQCSEIFHTDQQYGLHKQVHVPQSHHVCAYCKGKFCHNLALKRHVKRCRVFSRFKPMTPTPENGLYNPATFIDQTPPPSPKAANTNGESPESRDAAEPSSFLIGQRGESRDVVVSVTTQPPIGRAGHHSRQHSSSTTTSSSSEGSTPPVRDQGSRDIFQNDGTGLSAADQSRATNKKIVSPPIVPFSLAISSSKSCTSFSNSTGTTYGSPTAVVPYYETQEFLDRCPPKNEDPVDPKTNVKGADPDSVGSRDVNFCDTGASVTWTPPSSDSNDENLHSYDPLRTTQFHEEDSIEFVGDYAEALMGLGVVAADRPRLKSLCKNFVSEKQQQIVQQLKSSTPNDIVFPAIVDDVADNVGDMTDTKINGINFDDNFLVEQSPGKVEDLTFSSIETTPRRNNKKSATRQQLNKMRLKNIKSTSTTNLAVKIRPKILLSKFQLCQQQQKKNSAAAISNGIIDIPKKSGHKNCKNLKKTVTNGQRRSVKKSDQSYNYQKYNKNDRSLLNGHAVYPKNRTASRDANFEDSDDHEVCSGKNDHRVHNNDHCVHSSDHRPRSTTVAYPLKLEQDLLKLRCPHCVKRFTSQRLLKQHTAVHVTKEESSDQ